MHLRWGQASITGNFRENNEDNLFVDPGGRFFIVADGMGGQSAGEKASALAVELVPQRLNQLLQFDSEPPEQVVRSIDEAVAYANGEIMALGEVDPKYHNMGTTIVFIVCVAGKFYVGGVGDSRVYRLRGETFEQTTTDHSLVQALRDAGTITEEEAANHRYKNVLYRYLGTKEGGTGTNAREIDPQPGDRFLLCTDGVTDGIDDEAIAAVLKRYDDPQAAADALVVAAEEGGSRDNITCTVLYVE
jgi:serine/threonine protein phosphatase PrpC